MGTYRSNTGKLAGGEGYASILTTPENVQSALSHISPDLPRDEWVRIGMAVNDGLNGQGFEIFDQWSQGGKTYKPAAVRDAWKSIKPGGGVTIRTLWGMALDNGWQPDSALQQGLERKAKAAAGPDTKNEIRKEREAARKAKELWKAAMPLQADHPYFSRKLSDIPPPSTLREIPADHAAQILGYAPQSGGELLAGRLIVAPVNIDNNLTTAELIDESGRKSAIAGGPKRGGYWAAQRLPQGDGTGLTLLIGEGVATTLSAQAASGHPALAALSSGNLANLAGAMRRAYPAAAIVILADLLKTSGEPDPHAIKSAQAVGGLLAVPDFGDHRPANMKDFNDLHQAKGLDAVKEALAKANRAIPKASLKPDSGDEDTSWPRSQWRPESIADAGDTDMGNACRIFDRSGSNLLFVREIGWHTWNGSRWVFNEAGAKRQADQLSRLVLAEAAEALTNAAKENDERQRDYLGNKAKTLQAWAKKCETAKTIESALHMLERRLIVEPTDADADPFVLAVANGTLDLRSGQLRRSVRGDFITKGSGIAFDPTAACPIFEAFLSRIFRSHPEIIPFLRRAIGYTLTGDTREQCIFMLHGNGSNGKSTLVAILEFLLGDYAKQAAPDLLISKTGDRHPTEIADLRGARLVATVETGEGRRMAENLVKQMSGGDRMKGRYMRRDFFDFMPTHKLWLATNHKPAIRGTDLGIWRRIRLLPFAETIADHEKDPGLLVKLKAELPGILAWAVRGCLEWQRDGLRPPEAVTAATAAYRAENDVLAAFLDERCIVDRRAEVAATAIYKAYVEWCDIYGERAESQTAFGKQLSERDEIERSKSGIKVYRGIGLLDAKAKMDSWDSSDQKSS
jgi:putative DNA primase/helicase